MTGALLSNSYMTLIIQLNYTKVLLLLNGKSLYNLVFSFYIYAYHLLRYHQNLYVPSKPTLLYHIELYTQ